MFDSFQSDPTHIPLQNENKEDNWMPTTQQSVGGDLMLQFAQFQTTKFCNMLPIKVATKVLILNVMLHMTNWNNFGNSFSKNVSF